MCFGIAEFLELFLIDLGNAIKHAAAQVAVDALGILEVQDRFLAATKVDALVFAGQEAAAPQARVQSLIGRAGSARDHYDVGGQVLVRAAQAVADPGSKAGFAELLGAGENVGDGRIMVDGLGMHRFNDGDVIGNAANVRQGFVDPRAVLAHPFELKHRCHAGERFLSTGHGGEALTVADGIRQFFPVKFSHGRLVIEHVDVAGAAGVEQHDDTLGLGGKVRHAGQSAAGIGLWCGNGVRRHE